MPLDIAKILETSRNAPEDRLDIQDRGNDLFNFDIGINNLAGLSIPNLVAGSLGHSLGMPETTKNIVQHSLLTDVFLSVTQGMLADSFSTAVGIDFSLLSYDDLWKVQLDEEWNAQINALWEAGEQWNERIEKVVADAELLGITPDSDALSNGTIEDLEGTIEWVRAAREAGGPFFKAGIGALVVKPATSQKRRPSNAQYDIAFSRLITGACSNRREAYDRMITEMDSVDRDYLSNNATAYMDGFEAFKSALNRRSKQWKKMT